MSKPKILIFSLAYYPKHVGGAEVAIKEITDRIGDTYEFHLLCNRYDTTLPKTEQIGNVTVYRIGFTRKNTSISDTFHPLFYLVKILYIPLSAITAWRLNRKYRFDGFWSMMLYMSYPVALLRLLGVKTPYLLTLQEGDTPEHVFGRWYIKIFQPILLVGIRNAAIVQTISNFLSGWAKEKGYKGLLVKIPNAVNTQHFAQEYNETEIAAARQELGLSNDDVAVVTTSRLVHKNGIDDVIHAMVHLPKHIKFVIFGTGPDEQKLRDLAGKLGVTQRIIFYGFIDHAVMPKYLKACQIFTRPSRSEGMGNSFVEAMAARLPVIATQEGGIADFLFDAKRNPEQKATGWAVDADSPEQIAEAVIDIMNNPNAVSSVTETAYEMALAEYDWNLIASRMQKEVFIPLLQRNEN